MTATLGKGTARPKSNHYSFTGTALSDRPGTI
ncbi:hypothetical protein SBRY_20176 [Actinacidiphila bryophytorum]|uniref:Uncharacterized protein n=1 Tax=Actinacidiphila bryophytorum TaxID=1436133 RepID=A0A9W4GYW7_9ACTN|nr:hypothetical protein SBRY_20176 [Actinacidiphila bryophytorum]